MEEYLSKLHCNGCGKRCVLTNPRCSRGEQYREQKIQEFNSKESTNSTILQEESTKHLSTTSNSKKSTNSTDLQEKSAKHSDNTTNAGLIDYVLIIAFVVGGTHYIIKIPSMSKKEG
ncbi:MAG: hypothetical protein MR274_01780 [Clostridium sp.]|nr:hypothetical protein [Clostridium sp.]MDY3827253.1 hypothetical protein [Clostridium sp.]